MMVRAQTASLLVSVVLLALAAGVFYAYEVSVMRGFAILADREFIRAMQAVNATVRNLHFGLVFFGAAVACAAALLLHLPSWRTRAAAGAISGAILYLVGGLLLTVSINVPMNEWLASLGPADAIGDAAAVRSGYEARWVFWNQVRMVCSIGAFALMLSALTGIGSWRRDDRQQHCNSIT